MTETDIDIIEFTDEFNWEWLNNKFREHHLFGGIDKHIIPMKGGGYILPMPVSDMLDPYLMTLYTNEAGDNEIIETQEVYDTVINRGVKLIQVQCKAMTIEQQQVPALT